MSVVLFRDCNRVVKMKALSKPLSSPGRPDKFPPPLMRFLRSNVGSRSRGRSRSSPLFYLRNRRKVPIETTQEPSSPKVTCIGQVRVRRRSTTAAKKSNHRRRRWAAAVWRLKKVLFCGRISSGNRKNPLRRWFCKCCWIFRFGHCKKVDSKEDSLNGENVGAEDKTDFDQKEENSGDSGGSSCPPPPPKNALLLTRCRSAPYRSSSLGGRFWGSPLGGEESSVETKCNEEEKTESRICGESSKELVDSDTKEEGTVVVLTRCKSEPARTGERLVQESILPGTSS